MAVNVETLVEREQIFAQLEAALASLADDEASLLVLHGPAGIGKSSVLRKFAADVDRSGARVFSARGAELERDFPLGVVRQLFEVSLSTATEQQRERWLSGAAQLAQFLLQPPEAPGGTRPEMYARFHSLYWLAANMARAQALVLIVDDVAWADELSLAFLEFLARRLEGLPIALVVAATCTDAARDHGAN